MNVNTNQICSVILTVHGKKILDNHWLNVRGILHHERPTFLQYDGDGKYSSELWNIMSIFGKHLYNGGNQLFHDNIISIGDESMLQKYDTCELVKELSTREGVERIDVEVDGNVAMEIKDKNGGINVDNFDEGPIVILKIID